MTFILNFMFTEFRDVSMEHSQWVWHASRERSSFRIPGSVSLGTCFCSNFETSFLELLFFSIFHIEYPSVLSRFCFILKTLRLSKNGPKLAKICKLNPLDKLFKEIWLIDHRKYEFNGSR